jgi:hypothetical protein
MSHTLIALSGDVSHRCTAVTGRAARRARNAHTLGFRTSHGHNNAANFALGVPTDRWNKPDGAEDFVGEFSTSASAAMAACIRQQCQMWVTAPFPEFSTFSSAILLRSHLVFHRIS